MLQAAISIYSQHFAIWPVKRSVSERAVCHLAACSDSKDQWQYFPAVDELSNIFHYAYYVAYPSIRRTQK